MHDIKLYASPRSVGRMLQFRGDDLPVEVLSEDSFAGIDLALFCAGTAISKSYAAAAVKAGAVVVDN
ncbi:MAG: hypothetical protein JO122_03915 [Acetobacteraceae bacterium]|nr:hypothetical protein [Acetobacteraceae bacterium]